MPLSPQPLAAPSSLGLALSRLLAGVLYGLALLLIALDLPAALLALVAALLCLPATRVAMRRWLGVRLGGALGAAGVTALMVGAVLRAGTPLTPLAVPAGSEFVLATARVAKP